MSNVQVATALGGQSPVKQAIRRNIPMLHYKFLSWHLYTVRDKHHKNDAHCGFFE